MEQISTIIVDDEPLARQGLSTRMSQVEDFSVIAECGNGNDALVAIVEKQPDVVFVDIEMPGLNGIELAEALQNQASLPPKVVFVTAYREFALDAFNCHAFDYLLKPYSEERLDACLRKIRDAYKENNAFRKQRQLDQLLFRKTGKSLDAFVSTLEQSRQANLDDLQQHISVKSGTEWLRIKLDSILWIEAAGDYMCVHTLDTTHIVRKTLRQFEEELDVQRFPRINRSTIVNLTKVARLSPNSNGEYLAHLSSGQTVKVSRKYKLKLEELQRKSHVNPSGQSLPE